MDEKARAETMTTASDFDELAARATQGDVGALTLIRRLRECEPSVYLQEEAAAALERIAGSEEAVARAIEANAYVGEKQYVAGARDAARAVIALLSGGGDDGWRR